MGVVQKVVFRVLCIGLNSNELIAGEGKTNSLVDRLGMRSEQRTARPPHFCR